MNDPYDLARFVTAQDDAGTYRRALQELTDGRKRTHWMWFVFVDDPVPARATG